MQGTKAGGPTALIDANLADTKVPSQNNRQLEYFHNRQPGAKERISRYRPGERPCYNGSTKKAGGLSMKYGHFDQERREYVIDRVDVPVSWTNYLGVEDLCAVVNHTAGGYLFYKSPEHQDRKSVV